jgi:hypothetical protein
VREENTNGYIGAAAKIKEYFEFARAFFKIFLPRFARLRPCYKRTRARRFRGRSKRAPRHF